MSPRPRAPAGDTQARRQAGHGVDDMLDLGLRAGAAAARQIISGSPLGRLPQPALAHGGERQLSAGRAERRQAPDVPGYLLPIASATSPVMVTPPSTAGGTAAAPCRSRPRRYRRLTREPTGNARSVPTSGLRARAATQSRSTTTSLASKLPRDHAAAVAPTATPLILDLQPPWGH
jgi:hypothetical protein